MQSITKQVPRTQARNPSVPTFLATLVTRKVGVNRAVSVTHVCKHLLWLDLLLLMCLQRGTTANMCDHPISGARAAHTSTILVLKGPACQVRTSLDGGGPCLRPNRYLHYTT
jgi:hypothetical protein